MHHPLRLASAEPATLTSAAAYEGAVTRFSQFNRALSCANGRVRFGTYNARVTKTPAEHTRSLSLPSVPAASAVVR